MSYRLAAAALGAAVALLGSRPVAAQPPSELSLEEALALARQRAPALVEAAGRVAEARGGVAGALPLLHDNPILEAEAGPRTAPSQGGGMDVALGLAQPLELGGKRGARLELARAGVARAEAEQRVVRRRVLGEVASLFLRALHARERLRLARGAQEAAVELSQSTQRRFELGELPVVEANVARVALARARADVVGAEGEEAALLGELREVLGLPGEQPLAVRGDLSAWTRQPLEPTGSPRERPELLALAAQGEEARAEQRLAEAAAWPELTVGVRYEREADESAVHGVLSVPLPLFQRGQGARATSAARGQRLQATLEAARRTRQARVEAARTRYQKRREAVEVLEREALPLLSENESLARRSYEAGEMGLAELLLVRREVLDARGDYLARLLEAALSRVHFAVEIGALP
ncbi:MAG: TolC family protein [Myxococcaceae bacterium]|nr:TolC family protein [Myxococcaceae bacterium]